MEKYSDEHYKLLINFNFRDFQHWRSKNSNTVLNLCGADFSNKTIGFGDTYNKTCVSPAVFEGAILNNTIFNNCILNEVNFSNSSLIAAKFVESNLTNAIFEKTDLSESDLSTARLHRTIFCRSALNNALIHSGSECDFRETNLDNACITDNITRCKFNNAKGNNVKIKGSGNEPDFSNAQLSCSSFHSSNITNADFSNASLINNRFLKARFESCKFSNTIITGVIIENEVNFDFSDFSNAHVDRYTLECIPETTIPKHSRLIMNIEDDLAKLKQSYSGYYRVLNGILLFLFLAPYIKFIFLRWLEAKFDVLSSEKTITLIGAICRFIVSGGKSWQLEWQFDYLALTVFFIALSYNVLRTALLLKTIDLEHQQEIRGLPIKFSLKDSGLDKYLKASNIMFWFNLAAVIIHSGIFLFQRVNVGKG